jgi:hypothetical protein
MPNRLSGPSERGKRFANTKHLKKQSPHPGGNWDEGQACVRHADIKRRFRRYGATGGKPRSDRLSIFVK